MFEVVHETWSHDLEENITPVASWQSSLEGFVSITNTTVVYIVFVMDGKVSVSLVCCTHVEEYKYEYVGVKIR